MALTYPAGPDGERAAERAGDLRPVLPAGSRPGLVRRWLRPLVVGAGVLLAGLLLGFPVFLASLERREPQALPRGDAIVALTGGVERIPDAVGWLAQGHGERLLISGVGTQVRLDQLARKAPGLHTWLGCCVDVGHEALNTVGNAEETRAWAAGRGYRSLLVVTSSYHMPRAMLELRRHMPGVKLIAAPVVTDRLQDMRLWSDLPLLRTLGQEYAKFLVAYVRASLTRPAPMDQITANANRRRAS
jgi:uncharacterized SAM-binding protein YcdF (DUF218 family)